MLRSLTVFLGSLVVFVVALSWWEGRAGDLSTVVVGDDTAGPTSTAETPETAEPTPTSSPTSEPTPTPAPLGSVSCDTGGVDDPAGMVSVVPGDGATAGSGEIRTFTIEVEDGLAIDGGCFAVEVQRILFDGRSWVGTGEVTWRRVDQNPDTRIIVASPATTDQLCLPFRTNGVYSCTIEQERTVLNVDRWRDGAQDFLAIEEYRIYLVNHELGHALRHDHVDCPGSGLPAPVMMQQTKSIGSCVANPWPLRDGTEG